MGWKERSEWMYVFTDDTKWEEEEVGKESIQKAKTDTILNYFIWHRSRLVMSTVQYDEVEGNEIRLVEQLRGVIGCHSSQLSIFTV